MLDALDAALYGTDDHITGNMLENGILNTDPQAVLDDETDRGILARFIMNYALHAAPKEELKTQLQTVHYSLWTELIEDKNDEGFVDPVCNEHLCVLDFLTTSDLAYTMWQIINSCEDWEDKIRNKSAVVGNKVAMRYRRATKYTSDRSMPSMSHRSEEDEGQKMYAICLDWAKRLKRLGLASVRKENEGYMALTRQLNDLSISMGYIKRCGMQPVKASAADKEKIGWDVEEDDATPVFELDEFDKVPVVSV